MNKLFYAEAALQRKQRNFAYQTAKRVSPEQLQQQLQRATAAAAAPVALLQGAKTIRAQIGAEPEYLDYLRKIVCDEIAPALDLPQEVWRPFLHTPDACLSELEITASLKTKREDLLKNWGDAVLPVAKQYINRYKKLPVCLMYSLAACFVVQNNTQQANRLLADTSLWGESLLQLAGLERALHQNFDRICSEHPVRLPVELPTREPEERKD